MSAKIVQNPRKDIVSVDRWESGEMLDLQGFLLVNLVVGEVKQLQGLAFLRKCLLDRSSTKEEFFTVHNYEFHCYKASR